jgi:hypothetical protein
MVRAVVLGMAVAMAAGCGVSRSKSDWWAQLEANGFRFPDNRLVVAKRREDFVRIMGLPDKTQAIGEYTYWYYRCRDGEIQMVMMTMLLDAGQITTDSINEF